MIAPREARSTLKYPLDAVLGSPGMVRLVRVLAFETAGPVGVTDAARMAGLSSAGARKVLMRLADLGIAERAGTGRTLKFRSRKENPYLELLEKLFDKEHEQYENLITALRQALAIPEVFGAWIGHLPLDTGEPLQVEVVADIRAIGWIRDELRTRMIETEREHDLVIELALFTRADAPAAPTGAIIISSPGNPDTVESMGRIPIPEESEARSLKLAGAMAHLMEQDPSLVKRALRYVNRMLLDDQGMAGRDVAEWRQLLESYSVKRIRDLLVSSSSRASRLRRSMPFLSVLNQHERDVMIRYLEKHSDEI